MRPLFAWIALAVLASCTKPTPLSQPAAAPAVPATSAAGEPAKGDQTKAAPAAVAAAPQREPMTLPAGTPVEVRTTSTISSKTHAAGTMFTSTLERALVSGGRVLAPAGARVEGVVANVDPGGRVKGRANSCLVVEWP